MNFNELPASQGKIHVIVPDDQTTDDIIEQVLRAHQICENDYLKIAGRFNSLNPVDAAKMLFKFCKENIRYKIEPGSFQSTRSPQTIIEMGKGDCKHYAGFIAGVLDALRKLKGWNFNLWYRFASYQLFEETPQHVFVVMQYNGITYWIDPVLNSFNARVPVPFYYIDEKITKMPLVHISGIQDAIETEVVQRRNVGLIEDTDYPGKIYQPGSPSYTTAVPVPVSTITTPFYPESSPLGVRYLMPNGQDLVFPMQNPEGKLPPALPDGLNVVYPQTWGGRSVPSVLPRPMVAGNRLILLPKSFTQDIWKVDDWIWLTFMVRVMLPLVRSYSLYPKRYDTAIEGPKRLVNTTLGNAIFWDLDHRDVIDYVGNMPTLVPISLNILPGVKYLRLDPGTDGKEIVSEWKFPDRSPGEDPDWTKLPKKIWVEYPEYFNGVKVPAGLPYPYLMDNPGHPGTMRLVMWPKGFSYEMMKANYFFWLSFVTSVFAPIIKAFSPVDYTLIGNSLADRIMDDLDNVEMVQNYFDPPKDNTGLLQKAIDFYKNVITEIGKGFISISMLLPRQAFMLLVRVNFCGWGRKFHQNFKRVDFLEKTKKKWESLGGNFTNLVDSCENGREKVDLDPDDPATKTVDVGVISGARMGYTGVEEAIIIAAACIGAMAPILKMFTDDKTDAVIDGIAGVSGIVGNAVNGDPIGVGSQAGVPTVITDPQTGLPIVIPPPAGQVSFSFFDFIKANPVVSTVAGGLIAYLVYTFAVKKRAA